MPFFVEHFGLIDLLFGVSSHSSRSYLRNSSVLVYLYFFDPFVEQFKTKAAGPHGWAAHTFYDYVKYRLFIYANRIS